LKGLVLSTKEFYPAFLGEFPGIEVSWARLPDFGLFTQFPEAVQQGLPLMPGKSCSLALSPVKVPPISE
jgi:hypothetical protein